MFRIQVLYRIRGLQIFSASLLLAFSVFNVSLEQSVKVLNFEVQLINFFNL